MDDTEQTVQPAQPVQPAAQPIPSVQQPQSNILSQTGIQPLPSVQPQSNITIHPDNTAPEKPSFLSANKGLIMAAAAVILVVGIGLSAIFGFSSSNQYQGMIKKVKEETEVLKSQNR